MHITSFSDKNNINGLHFICAYDENRMKGMAMNIRQFISHVEYGFHFTLEKIDN